MSTILETRHSLLMRLRDRTDEAAWTEFVAVYEPVIYSLARRRGFQDADCREITQDVLLSVSQAIDRFDPAAGGSFRGWLSRITRNLAIDRLRGNSCTGTGRTDFHRVLADIPCQDESGEAVEFENARRRQLFLWAAAQVRPRFSVSNWTAFWNTCVLGRNASDVAKQLDISVGAVYVARCRILARIRELIQERTEE